MTPPLLSTPIQRQIRAFYDASSDVWERVWGEHMHHGFYGWDGCQRPDRRQAQVDLIAEILRWGQITQANQILDVGCGIGGSTLYLANHYQAQATGITLSPVQAQRAGIRAATAGLSSQTTFQVADAMAMPFADGSFDLVWSLESGEHMPDKAEFLQECCRVLQPGGKLIVATWCHRSCPPPLTPLEKRLLADIYRLYHLPYVIALEDYAAIAATLPLAEVKTADWSVAVAPFWDEVWGSALKPQALWGLLRSGWRTWQGAWAVPMMARGYRLGLIRYGLLCGTKQ